MTVLTHAPALILALTMALSGTVGSPEKERFSPERFKELQSANALIVLDVFADWCATCAKQQEVLAEYRRKHPDVKMHILEIDFDKDKGWVKEFKAPRQSTLIVYRGERRLWFSVAETRSEVIFAALNKADSHK